MTTQTVAPVRIAPARTTPAFLSRTAVAVVLGVSLVKGLSPFFEPDLWWHLRTGDRLRQGIGLTAWDPSAYFARQPYMATQWLPETVASWAYSIGGVGGVLWLRAVAIIALVVIVYAAARRFAGRLPAAFTAGLTLIAASGGLNPRPQLVSFVLFAVCIHAWIGMVRDRRPRWWLVPVFWLWACSHGLWIFGLVVGLVLLVSAVADPMTRPAPRELRRLAALWAACLVAVACTPLGPGLLATPFEVASNASMIAEEWRPTPLNNVFAWAAVLELLICVVCWAVRPQRRPWWQYALLAFAAATTMWMWRLVPLGAVAAAPLVAAALEDQLSAQRESFTRRERRGLGAAFVGLIAVAALLCATPIGASAARYPAGMRPIDQALKALPAHTVVLDDFGISGWLLWAHPDLHPVADLRGEIYGRDYLVAYQNVLTVKPGWEAFVANTGVCLSTSSVACSKPGAALVARDSALGDALRHRLHWRVAASTKDFLLITPG